MTPEEVRTKRATVVGGARSGRAAARLLAEAGGEVFLTEQGPHRVPIKLVVDPGLVENRLGAFRRRPLLGEKHLAPGLGQQPRHGPPTAGAAHHSRSFRAHFLWGHARA